MRMLSTGCFLVLFWLSGSAIAEPPVSASPEQMLAQADRSRTSNHAEFTLLLQRLGNGSLKLSPQQRVHLHYLQAFELSYSGDYASAVRLLEDVIKQSSDPVLRFRANLTAVNLMGITSDYESAFSRLNDLLDQLPHIKEKEARVQALATASQLYAQAGQYDLGLQYAAQLLQENPTGESACKAMLLKLDALYRSQQLKLFEKESQAGIDECVKADEPIYANGIRYFNASVDVRHGEDKAAISLLKKHYDEVKSTKYPPLVAMFAVTMAQAYLASGDLKLSKRFALEAADSSLKNRYTEPQADAYRILYLIEKRLGNMATALAYHEQYMVADKGFLNAVSAKALAYQRVKQQVLAKKLQVDTLSKQNRILQLQQALGNKAMEASRLWIILLVSLLAFIGFIAYRIKRSQLRFMKLAQRDGLTGIFNRQHFVSEAERQLQYCRKSARDVCLVLIDLDHFKVVNDTHGHAVGDRVLKRAVAACQSHLRSTDLFGRLGGEEFGMLLPECTLDQVTARVELMRASVASVSLGESVPDLTISASFGVSSAANSGYELRKLMSDADDALYQAKRDGRNRINLSDNRQAQMSLV